MHGQYVPYHLRPLCTNSVHRVAHSGPVPLLNPIFCAHPPVVLGIKTDYAIKTDEMELPEMTKFHVYAALPAPAADKMTKLRKFCDDYAAACVAGLTDPTRKAWLDLWSPTDKDKHAWTGPIGTPTVTGWDAISARAVKPFDQGGVTGFSAAKCDGVYPTNDPDKTAMTFTFTIANSGGATLPIADVFTFDADTKMKSLEVYADPSGKAAPPIAKKVL